MKDGDLNDALKVVSDKSFESTKIDVAKAIIEQNMLSSEQVAGMLKLFSFDDSKINIAEYAYTKTCDKNNYFKIYDSFTFETSIQTVKDYISKLK